MNRNSIAVLMSIAVACLAVAFVVIAVMSAGPSWAWVVLAVISVAGAGALLRVEVPATQHR